MKDKFEANFYFIVVTFIISGLLFGSMGIYAGSLLSSSDISYSNPSDITSNNVQGAIDEIYSRTNIGNAVASDILEDRSALVKGKTVNGSMRNNSGWSYSPTEIEIINIPEGYHNGEGYIDTQGLYDKFYVEVPLQIMAKEPDYVDRKTVKSGKSVSIDCGFRPAHMTIAYRNDNTSVDRIGLGFFDFVNEKRYLYWAPSPSEYQDDKGFSLNIISVTDTGFTYKSTATTDHYIIMFIYK